MTPARLVGTMARVRARLRLRTLVPLRRWYVEADGDVLRIVASSLAGPWEIPLAAVRCITLRHAEDGIYEWPFADEDLARNPNRLNPHASLGAGVTVEVWLARPVPPPMLRYPLGAASAPAPDQAVDQVGLPASPRRAAAFFGALGVPVVASYMAAAALTVGLVPADEPRSEADRAAYRAGLANWRGRRARAGRRAGWLLAGAIALVAAVIAFVPSGTGGWQGAGAVACLVAFVVALAAIPIVARRARHARTRRLLPGGSAPG